MKPTQLRAWVKRGGILGLLAVAVLLILHDLWYRKRSAVVVIVACSLLGLAAFLLRPPHAAKRDVALPSPNISFVPNTVEPPESDDWEEPLILHKKRGDYCADVEEYGPDKGTLVRVRRIKNGSVLWQRLSKDVSRLDDIEWSHDGRSRRSWVNLRPAPILR